MLPALLMLPMMPGCSASPTSGNDCTWVAAELPFHSTQFFADGVRHGSNTHKQMIRLNERWEAACR